MALALLALLPGRCRKLAPVEKPYEKCIVYRHKEDLPLDGAPFFDLYEQGQEHDTFRELWLRDELPFRAPLFQSEGGIPGTELNYMLTLEHQICLAAAADTCAFLKPYSGDNEHIGVSPFTRNIREYAPDIAISQERGSRMNERGNTYDNVAPMTQWEEDHKDTGFWKQHLYKGGTEPGDWGGTPRYTPWYGIPTREEAEQQEPFSLRAIDDYLEPADFKSSRRSGLDAISPNAVSCYDQCTWLRDKVAPLWVESKVGKDAECTSAHILFENGCWYDGAPAMDDKYYAQRPVTQHVENGHLGRATACHRGLVRGYYRVTDCSPHSGRAVEPRSLLPAARCRRKPGARSLMFAVSNCQVTQFQRQKLAAMFSACDWLGVAEVPLWVLRDLQDVISLPVDAESAGPRIKFPLATIPYHGEGGTPAGFETPRDLVWPTAAPHGALWQI